MKSSASLITAIAAVVAAHGDHSQKTLEGPHQGLWYNTLPGDGGTQVRDTVMAVMAIAEHLQADSVFSGISTFGRLDYHPCLKDDKVTYDIAFIGS